MSTNDIASQHQSFFKLIAKLEKANPQQIEKVLSQREIVEPEPELTPEIIDRLKTKIQNQNNRECDL